MNCEENVVGKTAPKKQVYIKKTVQQIPLQNTIRNPPHTQCDIPTHASTEFTLCANLTECEESNIFLNI